MSSPPIIPKKSWTTGDRTFTFNYEFEYGIQPDFPIITLTVVGNDSPIVETSPPSNPFQVSQRDETRFEFTCENGDQIQGTLRLVPFRSSLSVDDAGIWADVYFGPELFEHFEGEMITFQSSTPGIIISAHGGRWSNQSKNLVVPKDSKIVYYVNDGQILSNHDGYDILDNLMNAIVPGGQVAQEVTSGNVTYDYSCWYAPEFAAHCGIFEVGSSELVESLVPYPESNPLLLSQIFQRYPGRTVYWVCCREVSDPETTETLVNTPGAFLSV